MDWWMWLAGGLILLVIELVTPSGFFVMFFGLGALTVGVLAAFNAAGPLWTQWLLFSAASIAFVMGFRGRLQARFEQSPPTQPVDTMIGELATPTERLLPGAVGRVEMRGTSWTARNDGAQVLEFGQRCRVVRVEGLTLGVLPE